MRVRPAEPNDAGAIESLYRILVPGDPNVRVAPERIESLRADRCNRLLVAELEGVVCGTAFVSLALDAMYGFHPFATVENVIVHPSRRGKGIGRLLMAAVEDEARAAKCTKLMLLSSATRSEAHAFFSSMGFDSEKKKGFVKYLARTRPLRASGLNSMEE